MERKGVASDMPTYDEDGQKIVQMPYISIVPPTKHDALYKMDFLNKTQAMNEKIAAEMIDTQNVLRD